MTSFEIDSNLDIKKSSVDKPKLSSEFTLLVLDFDKTKIKILTSNENPKSKIGDLIKKPIFELELKKAKKESIILIIIR
jgi:hypothetical protein